MLVKDLMQPNPVTALPSESARDIANMMAELNIGSVLICEKNGKLRGIVTDRDIAIKVVAKKRDPATTTAQEFMSTYLAVARYDAHLDEALKTMSQTHTRRLPVINEEEDRLVGILSTADLAGAVKDRVDQFLGLEEHFIRH